MLAYFLAFFICLVFFASLFFSRKGEETPDFTLSPPLTEQQLMPAVARLAVQGRRQVASGPGLSAALIKTYIKRAYDHIAARVEGGHPAHDFENWLYDNYYKLEETLTELCAGLSGFKNLPHVNGIPRLYRFLALIVKASEGYVDQTVLETCVRRYNAETPLSYAEIRAVPAMLRFVFLEYVTIFAAKSLKIEEMTVRGRADAAREKIDLADTAYSSYLCALFDAASERMKSRIRQFCTANGIDFAARQNSFLHSLTRYAGRMQAALKALYGTDTWLTEAYVVSLSPVHALLAEEQGIVYNQTTLSTKVLFLERLAAAAKKQKRLETGCAAEAAARARAENRDIAYILLPPPKSRAAMRLYALSQILLSFAAAAGLYVVFPVYPGLFSALSLLPVLFALQPLYHFFVVRLTKRRVLPGIDIRYAERDVGACLVCPRLIADGREAADAVEQLKMTAAANPDGRLSYALLVDLLSAGSPALSEADRAVIDVLRTGFSGLDHERFSLLIRKRVKLPDRELYQGWEKKRGALCDFNALALRGEREPFLLIEGGGYEKKYAVVLDSDTLFNDAVKLIELLEHPFNADYTVLGIRMTTHPDSAAATPFSRLFCGARGLSAYTTLGCEPHFDLFGQGNFTGKGIYRVAAFDQKLAGVFPDDRILSHDFIEGAWTGAANTDVCAMDGFPSGYASFMTRQLRWLRGDWQLLPYLFGRVKNRAGKRIKNPLPPIAKWHIFFNMAAGLLPLVSMALFAAALFSPGGFIPVILALLPGLAALFWALKGLRFHPIDFLSEAARQLFWWGALPAAAWYYTKAVVVTCGRLIAKKNLLEWRVFAHGSKKRLSPLPNFLSAAALLAGNFFLRGQPVLYALGGLFFLFPILETALSAPRKDKRKPPLEAGLLRLTSQRTWAYFSAQLNEKNHFLPCDNYQEYLSKGWQTRTSPTNIGMALAAVVSAEMLGFITRERRDFLLDNMLSAVEGLPKWRGNLYNWYDAASQKALPPAYVSTVDSGNFLLCLMLVSAASEGAIKGRAERLIGECELGALFDKARALFKIGYNDTSKAFDANCYDLLGSESVMTYLAGIALNKIPKTAWFNLSRRLVRYRGRLLYSWTGGMFEYLFSPLFFSYPQGTLLKKSCENAVKGQLYFGRDRAYWGVSESQYPAIEDNGDYKYRASGVPGLSLSRHAEALAAAPYASLLALEYRPERAIAQLRRFHENGLFDRYGLYEAHADGETVRAYMTHHQGMILCALCNYEKGGILRETLYRDPRIRAASLLLCEPMPVLRVPKKRRPPKKTAIRPTETAAVGGRREIPHLNLLTNGRYAAVIDARGRGYAALNGKAVSRRRTDCGFLLKLSGEDGETVDLLADAREVEFSAGSARFRALTKSFESAVTAAVLPECGGEVRILALKNKQPFTQVYTVTSEIQPVLTDFSHDEAHREYSNLFVETRYDAEADAVTACRKSEPLYAAHFAVGGEKPTYETNRLNLLGGTEAPSFGHVLDPVLSAAVRVTLKPYEERELAFYLTAASDPETLSRSALLIRSGGYLKRAVFDRPRYAADGWTRQTAAVLSAGTGFYRDNGLAGILNRTRPLIALELKNAEGAQRLEKQLSQLKFLFLFGFSFHTVILYDEAYQYFTGVENLVAAIVERLDFKRCMTAGSLYFAVNTHQNKALKELYLSNSVDAHRDYPEIKRGLSVLGKPYENPPGKAFEYAFKTGIGGYLADGSFGIDLAEAQPERPWSNVLSNGKLGTVITHTGGGYTFFDNAREKRLSPFGNDAASDPCFERIVLGERGVLWSIAQKPLKTPSRHLVKHGLGYTVFYNNYNGFESALTQFVGRSDTKYYAVKLKNCEKAIRSVDVLFSFVPVLGDTLENTRASLRFGRAEDGLYAQNVRTGLKMYAHASEALRSFSFSGGLLTDADGRIVKNAELKAGAVEDSLNLSIRVSVAPGQTKKVYFSAGGSASVDFSAIDTLFHEIKAECAALSCLSFETGDTALDQLVKWLPYQVLNSRFYGRTGYYQSGGAYGFRDQLQDCLALLYHDPKLVRAHILDSAQHQYEAGDVMHWWHPPATGIRTHFVDDRLFLPYVTAKYIEYTGESEILAARLPYLRAEPLPLEKRSLYHTPPLTEYTDSLLSHCLRAIDSTALSASGLVLMKGGDWNDAMDGIGEKGKGVSVWASMFLHMVIDAFLPYIARPDIKEKYRAVKRRLRAAVELSWDGEWYRRAVTDDGRPVGSVQAKEGKIDLLSQAFAALSGIADPDRASIAQFSAEKRLVDDEARLIKLLDPPFTATKGIGYIADYPPGVRENGGQYTHAAVWYIMSLYQSGRHNRAYELLEYVNPVTHALTPADVKRYKAEPYVVAADVYAGAFSGRGGWSWYTGAAGWLYQCIVQCLFGVRIKNNTLTVEPRLPDKIPSAKIEVRTQACRVSIEIDNTVKTGRWRLRIDGVSYNTNSVKLIRALSGKKIALKRESCLT
ncbi:MAG: hypothetical protein LBH24_03340 [Clostridiales bacterium]|jgi:cyclic beta-1,2-glucan synthetase|nr:hypothetical protein [Clostridiales bacterium]